MLLHTLGMVLHIDRFLGTFIDRYGVWIYGVLFLIVFCETGLVVLPFLPGDSLLFVAGTFCARHEISLTVLFGVLSTAAISGNTVNYLIGRLIGLRVYQWNWCLIDRQALQKTHNFYQRHGGKTVVLARFVPIVRTFAPFVAGLSAMSAGRFQTFNIIGALVWVIGLLLAGYWFGNLPFIRDYLNVIALAGVCAAIVPTALMGLWRLGQRHRKPKLARPRR